MAVTKEQIREIFPELDLVKNKDWIEITCNIWKTVFERSKWKSLEAALFGEYENPKVPLIEHTRATTQYCIQIAKMIRDFHKYETPIDMDVLIIASILHDVSKLLEFEPDDDRASCHVSETGYTYQHGFYGAHYAEAGGLPSSIVTVIINHTAMSRVMPSTVEGNILFLADQADAEMHKCLHGKTSMILKALGKISR